MAEDPVLLKSEDGIAHVTLNRPEIHNAFDETVIARLTAIWDDLAQRKDIRAVVLTGNGKSFSAGADINWMKRAASYTEERNYQDALKLAQMLNRLHTLPQLTIACVQGAAMGGGLGLVACCDVAIADKDAMFALSEVKLGVIPATIGPYVIRAIGERQARRYFQTGERFDGAKAHEIGLVHRVAERPEDMEYLLHTLLKEIATNGPLATREAKRLCRDLSGPPVTQAVMEDTARRIAAIRTGTEAQERLSAFLEKRKAG